MHKNGYTVVELVVCVIALMILVTVGSAVMAGLHWLFTGKPIF